MKVTGLTKKSIRAPKGRDHHELVILSGMSGAGKGSALKTFEDLGFYCVDNLPVGLISNFAELVVDSSEIQRRRGERECGEDRDSCVRRVAESAESAEGRSPSFARIGRLKAAPPSARPSFARIGKLKHAPPTARPSFARMHKAEPYATGN